MSEENLPATQSEGVEIEAPKRIDKDYTIDQVIDADREHMNDILQGMHLCWGRVNTVGQVCKLAEATANLLVTRRKLLNLPYANETNNTKRTIAYPLD